MTKMKVIPLLLAGGEGTRFWPLSRKNSPKQVLNLSGRNTLIAEAVQRFENFSPISDMHIVTTEDQARQIANALADGIGNDIQYILEPVQRGTSACVLMSAMKIMKKYGDCILCVAPSDHFITDHTGFCNTVSAAIACAEEHDKIVTLGIQPTFPATGYGYIRCDYSAQHEKAYEVREFIEKPIASIAKVFVQSGDYFWNSGIFVFKLSVILDSFQRFLPRMYDAMMIWYAFEGSPEQEKHIFNDTYSSLQNISLDYGIIERSNHVYMIPANIGWSDIGSWDSLGALFPPDESGNIVRAQTVNIETKNCVLYSENALIATIGVEDLIIVSCEDALMVCAKSKAQRVKELVDQMKAKNLHEFL
jgi:mannose-1-phosphate guanylyltransferase